MCCCSSVHVAENVCRKKDKHIAKLHKFIFHMKEMVLR